MSELEILKTDLDLGLKEILALDRNIFPFSIPNKSTLANFSLLATKQNLFFSVSLKNSTHFDKELKCNQFQPELWKKDLSEIFFAEEIGENYQEFNFSPAGAYWQTRLSSYRQKIVSTELPVPELQIQTKLESDSQLIVAQIPIKSIFSQLKAGSRINCTAILGENPRSYFATCPLEPSKPDFHRAELWPRIKFSRF